MYNVGSDEKALKELREISAELDRIQAELDEIGKELDKPVTDHM